MNCIDCKWCFHWDKQCKEASPEIRSCERYEKIKKEINVIKNKE